MSGFLLNLKRANKPGKPGGAAKGVEKKKPKGFVESDSDEDKVITIDGFDSRGATTGSTAVNTKPKQEPLVITPVQLNKSIPKTYIPNQQQGPVVVELEQKLKYGLTEFTPSPSKTQQVSEEPHTDTDMTRDEKIRASLLNGENPDNDAEFVIPLAQDNEEEPQYDDVPVDQFGAALLRGMGWKPQKSKVVKPKSVENRRKGVLLGIGAKAVELDVMEELHGKRGAKFEIPLVKKDRQTGEIIREE